MSHAASLGGRAHRCARKWTTKHAGARVWVMCEGVDTHTVYMIREYYRKRLFHLGLHFMMKRLAT